MYVVFHEGYVHVRSVSLVVPTEIVDCICARKYARARISREPTRSRIFAQECG